MTTAAFTAAVVVFVTLTLPPRARHLSGSLPATDVPGGYHIHTIRSDGSGTVDDIAAAAARAGLRFLVFTDHGDATRVPDAPVYRHGVLCLDAVEINSREGHIVAIGLSGPAPYPLAGPARDVIEDIHRLGGYAIVAHPDSPSAALRWRGMQQAFDGIEWLNVDSEWRDDSTAHLLLAGARSVIRPAEAIATLLTRPVQSLRRLDNAARLRSVFTLAALDAHARIGTDTGNSSAPAPARFALDLPSYEALFRTLAQVAIVDAPLTGDAQADAARVISALTHGRSYTLVRALAAPAALGFSAEHGGRPIAMGERVPFQPGESVRLHGRVDGAPGAMLTLYENGRAVARGTGQLDATRTGPGVYRIEATLPGATVPWIASNPITVEPVLPDGGRPQRPALVSAGTELLTLPASSSIWTIERPPASSGERTVDGERLRFDYRLAPGVPRGQYAALVAPIAGTAGIDRIQFVGAANRPTRLSVQIRLPGGKDGGERWRRSVYLDETPRPIVLWLQDFEPVGPPTTRRPIVTPIQSVLFVVDTVNTKPGAAGSIWLSQVSLGINRLSAR
jgi:hypothetical protein